MTKFDIPKEFPILVSLLVSALVLFNLSIDNVSAGSNRNYSKGLKIAKEVLAREASISSYNVLELLRNLKSEMLGSLSMDVATQSLNPEEQLTLVKALALARLTEVNWEYCLESDRVIPDRNYHKYNYIEMNRWMNEVYQSDNMREIIKNYFEAQTFICRNGLKAHFGLKLKEIRLNLIKFDRFTDILNYSFIPHELELNMLDLERKVDGIVNFITTFYSTNELDKTIRSHGSLTHLFNFRFKVDCTIFVRVPLGTLMMTYEHINRSDLSFTRKYYDVIRAYDLCNLLKILTPEEEALLTSKFANVSMSDAYAAQKEYRARADDKRVNYNPYTGDHFTTTSLSIPTHRYSTLNLAGTSQDAGPSQVDQSGDEQQVAQGNQNQGEDDEWLKLRL